MASGATSFLTLTLPGFAAILSVYWLVKRKNTVLLGKICEDRKSIEFCDSPTFMNLKETDEVVHCQKGKGVVGVGTTGSKMHLKEKVEGTEQSTVSGKAGSSYAQITAKSKVKCLKSSSETKSTTVHENGDTCSHVEGDESQKKLTNGTKSPPTVCDNGDNACTAATSTTPNGLEPQNGASNTGKSSDVEDLTNGMESIDLKSTKCNGEQPPAVVENGTTHVSNGHSDSTANKDTTHLTNETDKQEAESPLNGENIVCSDCVSSFKKLPLNVTEELTCDTSFVPDSSTPDSGLSAELQESDALSSLSELSSDGATNGHLLKSPVISVISNDSGKECNERLEDIDERIQDFDETVQDLDETVQNCEGSDETCLAFYNADVPCVYEFEIPADLCGLLIGRNGRHVKYLKEKSNANILIKDHRLLPNVKICSVAGIGDEIDHALYLIRERFPEESHPELTLDEISSLQNECTLPITVNLALPEGVSFDAVLSSTVNAGQFFLQQPTHPTHHSLPYLTQDMTSWYSQYETPKLCRIACGNIVAAPMAGGWYRAQVVSIDIEQEDCVIKFLDFGGYSHMPISELRQMKIEYSYVPFQAVECFLGNVTYPEGETEWSEQAKALFEELAQGQILQGYIVQYDSNHVPYVHLYRVQGSLQIFINRELVNRGLAKWIELEFKNVCLPRPLLRSIC